MYCYKYYYYSITDSSSNTNNTNNGYKNVTCTNFLKTFFPIFNFFILFFVHIHWTNKWIDMMLLWYNDSHPELIHNIFRALYNN